MIEDEPDAVYAYIMSSSSVVLDGVNLLRKGTGPNFQGGYITLCTCKHRMRTTLPADEWRGTWVAGFTSVECGGRHWLLYLGKVKEAYESQSELWHSNALPQRRDTQSPPNTPDLATYMNRRVSLTPWAATTPSSTTYQSLSTVIISMPVTTTGDSTSITARKKLKVKAKRQPSLLVLAQEFSFLWRKPLLYGRWRPGIMARSIIPRLMSLLPDNDNRLWEKTHNGNRPPNADYRLPVRKHVVFASVRDG